MPDIVTDISINQNWNARKGANNPVTFTFTQNAAAFNISTYTFSVQLRKFGSSTNLLNLTQGSGITNNGAAGTLNVVFTSANLTNLVANDYYWQMTVVHPDTFSYLWYQGTFNLYSETYTGDLTTAVTGTIDLNGTTINSAITLGVSDTLTDGNGTTANGSAVDLGGNLNANTQILGPSYTFSFGNEDLSPLESFSAAGGIDTTSGVSRIFLNELYSQLSFEKIYGSTYMNVKQRLGQNFDTVPEYGYAISFKRGGDTEVIALRITPQDSAGTPRTWELNFGSDATGDQYTRDASGYLIRKGITSTASTATLTIDSDNTYLAIVTAQAEAITIANPTGTPFTGQELSISLKDNGVSRAISFGGGYVEFETFPTATTAGKRMYLGFIYNGTGWDYMGSRTQL